MPDDQPNNPLHGVTLKALLTQLVDEHGWESLGEQVRIQCFLNDPSIKSSLKFLRKTPWARAKVEQLYLSDLRQRERKRKRNLRRAARRAYAEQVASEDSEPSTESGAAVDGAPEAPQTDTGWSFDRS